MTEAQSLEAIRATAQLVNTYLSRLSSGHIENTGDQAGAWVAAAFKAAYPAIAKVVVENY